MIHSGVSRESLRTHIHKTRQNTYTHTIYTHAHPDTHTTASNREELRRVKVERWDRDKREFEIVKERQPGTLKKSEEESRNWVFVYKKIGRAHV